MPLSISGVPWILNVISFSITFIGTGEHDQAIKNMEFVLDLVNLPSVRNFSFLSRLISVCVQGLLIFIIFVCKKSTFDKLKSRFGKGRLGEILHNLGSQQTQQTDLKSSEI